MPRGRILRSATNGLPQPGLSQLELAPAGGPQASGQGTERIGGSQLGGSIVGGQRLVVAMRHFQGIAELDQRHRTLWAELPFELRHLGLGGAELAARGFDADQKSAFGDRIRMLLQIREEERARLFDAAFVHQHGGARQRRSGRGAAGRQAGAPAEHQQQPREHRAAMLALARRMSAASTAIQSVAVVGAGQMGAGIAQVAARAGLSVTLSDQAEAQAAQAVSKLEARLRRQEADGKVPTGTTSELVGRIRTGGPLSGVADADLVIEAAPEQLELKA